MKRPCYLLRVDADFSASHILYGYDGPCARLHGHNWKVEVEVMTHELDNIGMGMDFRTIKLAVRALCEELDHRHLNDIPPFTTDNPTAENIGRWFYEKLSDSLNTQVSTLKSVTIWENDCSRVQYSQELG